MTMSPEQIKLARHALGFPNKKNESYRNHFCTGPGSVDFEHWEDLVSKGLAVKRTDGPWGGDHMFYLTLEAALMVRGPKEHLSREDAEHMRTYKPQSANAEKPQPTNEG